MRCGNAGTSLEGYGGRDVFLIWTTIRREVIARAVPLRFAGNFNLVSRVVIGADEQHGVVVSAHVKHIITCLFGHQDTAKALAVIIRLVRLNAEGGADPGLIRTVRIGGQVGMHLT